MKKKLSILIVALTACLIMLLATGCNPDPAQQTSRTGDTFVRIDINPSIELVVDANNKVVSVYGANSDGTVLVYGETENYTGKDLDAVLAAITDSAVKLGYLTENNKTVQYTVISTDGEQAEAELAEKISAKITATASSLGLTITTDSSGSYSLLRQLEAYKAEHPDDTKIQNLSVAEFRLALSASETGEISLEAAIELDEKQLVATIKEAGSHVKDYATAEYKALKAAADAAYENASATALDGIYATYYLTKMASHPTTWYYGSVYQMYATAAHGLDAINCALQYQQQLASVALNEETAVAVLTALGLTEEDIALIRDDDNNITLESIYAYADKTYKNSDLSANIDDIKASLDAAVAEAEKGYAAEKEAILKNYEPQLQAIYTSAKALADSAKTSISVLGALVPQSVKDLVAEMETAADKLTALLGKDDLSSDDIAALSAEFSDKAAETLELIKNDLSEEELAEVENIRAAAEATLSAAKTEYGNAIAKAEQSARDAIENIRNRRLQNSNAE